MRYFILLSLMLVGCQRTEVQQVSGSLLLDDAPLAEVSVCFWPETDDTLGVMCHPKTESDGSFVIHPVPERGQGRAGDYVVLVVKPMLVPRKYREPETSPLRARIEPGVNELEPIRLQGDPEELRRLIQAVETLARFGVKLPL